MFVGAGLAREASSNLLWVLLWVLLWERASTHKTCAMCLITVGASLLAKGSLEAVWQGRDSPQGRDLRTYPFDAPRRFTGSALTAAHFCQTAECRTTTKIPKKALPRRTALAALRCPSLRSRSVGTP